MRSSAWVVRAVALLSVGAIALHQLRFAFGYGQSATEALALQGHSYIPFAEALIVVACAAAFLWFVGSLALAHRGAPIDSSGPPFGRLWACATAALFAVYTVQEGFEGQFSAGHPAGLVGIFGHGGWIVFPLALTIGALVALVLEGARRVIVFVSSRARLPRAPRRRARWHRLPIGFPNLDVLCHSIAPRGPPLSS
jgi:hypothetical protein